MAGGGAAFSQTLQSQDETNMGSGEPVIRYGTGGRITHGVRRFDVGGDTSWGTISNADYGGDSGPGDFGYSGSYGGDGGAYDLGINPDTGAVKFDFTGMAPPDYGPASGSSPGGDFVPGDLDSGPTANPLGDGINDIFDANRFGPTPDGVGPFIDDVPEIEIVSDRPVTEPYVAPYIELPYVDPYIAPFVEDDVPEIEIVDDRPVKDPYVAPYVAPFVDPYVAPFVEDDVPEIVITDDRPVKEPEPFVPEIVITDDRPVKDPVVEPEIPEIEIVDDRPVKDTCPSPEMRILLADGSLKTAGELQVGDVVRTQHETTLAWGDHAVTQTSIISDSPRIKIKFDSVEFICSPSHKFFKAVGDWVTAENIRLGDMINGQVVRGMEQTDSGDVVSITIEDAHTYICEGLLSHNKSKLPPYVAPFVEDPYVAPFVEDPYVAPFVEDPYVPPYVPPYKPPYVPPYKPPYVPPVVPPAEPFVPPTARNIYRSQYQNYADPLTMFNVSNYGTDPATSAGYNFATGPQGMGIAQLNQNLRDMAERQMSQTYPSGLPKGADMNAVLSEMRKYGLTATDLENARYGRTTGLNTPFSQYNKEAPTARTFGGGIAELIKNLPK
jgi:hypothetical protein